MTKQTVSEAVSDGSLRDQLDAMRVRIATAIDSPEIRGADLAALSRRLHELTKEIAAIDVAEAEESGGDPQHDVDSGFDAAAI